jgi:hypothetical protein
MASAKKSKKKSVRKATKPTAHQRLEQATTPEELLAGLPAVTEAHNEQVRILGNRIIKVIEEAKFHPVVALDALQVLLSAGVGAALGDQHQQLFDAHIHRYHDESKMLSIMEMLGGISGLERVEIGEEPVDTKSPYYRAGEGPAETEPEKK